jgi:organic radical activating enzyme
MPGNAEFVSHENPVDLRKITRLVTEWQKNYHNFHHSVVLTGGEPLLHAGVLKEWLPEIKPLVPVFLETNGTLPAELEMILPLVDLVSMDVKGSSTTGMVTPWAEHARFMTLANERLCQVKLVVDATTTDEEMLHAAMLVHRHAPETPLILQPRTTATGPVPGGRELLRLQQVAAAEHHDVRIIPQVHPLLGVA